MMRRFDPYREQGRALEELGGMLDRRDAELAHMQEQYAAKWTDAKRQAAVQSGDALPGGKFPITDQEDLNNAVGLMGNSTLGKATVEAHIRKQAKKHGLSLPSSWSGS